MIEKRQQHAACVICKLPRGLWQRREQRYGVHSVAYCSHVCKRAAEAFRNRIYPLIAAAVRFGMLPPAKTQACADCGQKATCYDHRDYSKPLEVDAVCHGCNIRRGPGLHPVGSLVFLPRKRFTNASESFGGIR